MPAVRYRLAMPEPHTHLYRVAIELEVGGPADLVMPSWTPGSYLLREFPRNVQEFRAEDAAGRPLRWQKVDKNSWRLDAATSGQVRVSYGVYANELTVRTSHLDASHGYVNGASVFMYVRGREAEPLELEVEAPSEWKVTTPLRSSAGPGRFHAADYHQLVDSPLEIGTHAVLEFEAVGRAHAYAIWGRGNYQPGRLLRDTKRIVETAAAMWGDELPYERYLFFLHLVPGSRGSLEHRESCSLHADRWAFAGADYEQFLALVTHEFFHTWNGTRIRPAPLAAVDYTRENYTRNLWVIEGLTTYYTDLLLRRAGIIGADRYLERLGDAIHRYRGLPGRRVQSLAESSFDSWIKFYRPDEHTPNAQVSYYQKGALVGLLLDMRIREASGNEKSLDDVMRLLWRTYGARDVGFPEETGAGIQAAAEEVAGEPLDDFFAAYLFGTDELDFDGHLAAAGLELKLEETPAATASSAAARTAEPVRPALSLAAGTDALLEYGLRLEEKEGRTSIGMVRSGSAVYRAGLNARDELLAVDGLRMTAARLPAYLAGRKPGDRLTFTVLRRDELLQLPVTLDVGRAKRLRLVPTSEPTPRQLALREDWLAEVPTAAASGAPSA